MQIETLEDWLTFSDPDIFGVVVEYFPANFASIETQGILTDDSEIVAESGTGITASLPILMLHQLALEVEPRPNDQAKINHITYRIAEIRPDGTGIFRLFLERT